MSLLPSLLKSPVSATDQLVIPERRGRQNLRAIHEPDLHIAPGIVAKYRASRAAMIMVSPPPATACPVKLILPGTDIVWAGIDALLAPFS